MLKKIIYLLIIPLIIIGFSGCDSTLNDNHFAKEAIVQYYKKTFVSVPNECISCIKYDKKTNVYTMQIKYDPNEVYPDLYDDMEVETYENVLYVKVNNDNYDVYNSDDVHLYTYIPEADK